MTTSDPHNVLVVDDDPDLRTTMQLSLEYYGYGVVTARDGREALAKLRDGASPCVILLDMMMPGMSGLQFRTEQLRDPALAAIPVIAWSGDMKLIQQASALGAEVYVKPVDLTVLVDRVRVLCSSSHPQEEQMN
jgi:CheY-like chemotaxis protein